MRGDENTDPLCHGASSGTVVVLHSSISTPCSPAAAKLAENCSAACALHGQLAALREPGPASLCNKRDRNRHICDRGHTLPTRVSLL